VVKFQDLSQLAVLDGSRPSGNTYVGFADVTHRAQFSQFRKQSELISQLEHQIAPFVNVHSGFQIEFFLVESHAPDILFLELLNRRTRHRIAREIHRLVIIFKIISDGQV
jgi:hypothetical protein